MKINGVINIFKEEGCTSFHVVYQIRKITGEQKVGHTGTLDPDVTGVLPVCIGKATKLVGQLTDTDKTYRCRMRLGLRTDTQDLSGQVLERMDRTQVLNRLAGSDEVALHQKIVAALQSFTGEISQIPPMFSALKVDGMKLVNAARKGVVVERQPRTVTIHAIEDIAISEDLMQVDFTVTCSKGTYVRTLCEDAGKKLGVPACMESLQRTRAAGLSIDSAVTIEQVKELFEAGRQSECIIPTDRFLMVYPPLIVTEEAIKKLIYGNYLYDTDFTDILPDTSVLESTKTDLGQNAAAAFRPEGDSEAIFRIYDRKGIFYALYRYDRKADCYKCVKMFQDP